MWKWTGNPIGRLKEQNRLLAQQVNDRDEHIRLLTENTTAMALKIQRLEPGIAHISKHAAGVTEPGARNIHKTENAEPVDSIVVEEARRHLNKALADVSPSQPSY